MSKYQITHTCGHTVEHNIIGTNAHGERDSKAAWLTARVCQDCYREQQRQAAAEATQDLPALTGSDKQIAWATTIRAEAATSLRELRDALAPYLDTDPANAAAAIKIVDDTLAQTAASYWIDHRLTRYNRQWLAEKFGK